MTRRIWGRRGLGEAKSAELATASGAQVYLDGTILATCLACLRYRLDVLHTSASDRFSHEIEFG